jgi:hypothetical protein
LELKVDDGQGQSDRQRHVRLELSMDVRRGTKRICHGSGKVESS